MEKVVSWVKGPFVESAKSYFMKAALLMVVLYVVGSAAPRWPLALLLLAVIAYAVVVTIGSLHFVVMRRMLRRYKLREDGDLARRNQRWLCFTFGIFIVSLISGVLFVVEAPGWSDLVWLFLLLSVVVYFSTYWLALKFIRRQLADRFDKAAAMKWAYWITAVFLCLAYLVAAPSQSPEVSTMAAAFAQAPVPYSNSPAPLLVDLDALASFTEGLKLFAYGKMSEAYAWVGIVMEALVFAATVLGLTSLLCCCLLDRREVEEEFQELPPVGCMPDASRPPVWEYFIIIAVVALAFCCGAAALNCSFGELHSRDGGTCIETHVEKWKSDFSTLYDTGAEISATEREMLDRLEPLLDGYYDRCKDNIDPYLDSREEDDTPWFVALRDWAISWFTPDDKAEDEAKEFFLERITEGADSEEIERAYAESRLGLVEKYRSFDDGMNGMLGIDVSVAGERDVNLPATLDLWQPLNNRETVKEILLSDGLSRDELKDQIAGLIDGARQDAFNTLSILAMDSDLRSE